jgi:putative transposase
VRPQGLFQIVKDCPLYPTKPFASLEDACAWVTTFLQWYNHEHLHSGIRFTTSARHSGTDVAILVNRDRVYQAAQRTYSARWSGATRQWTRIACVTLNVGKDGLPSATMEPRCTRVATDLLTIVTGQVNGRNEGVGSVSMENGRLTS